MKSVIYVLVATVILVSCKQKKENNTVKEDVVESIDKNVSEEWVTLFDGTSFDN
jgi:hypothetical protein